MALLLSATLAVFVSAAVTGDETTMPPFDCSKINNIPWVGNAYNPESDKCELKTTYGSCTPPKGFLNTCEDCQRNITGGEANKLCTGLKIFISPSTKATPCEPSVRWQWNTYSGRCSNLTYGCLAQPETVGFDDESTCLETCKDIPLCGPASELKPTTIAEQGDETTMPPFDCSKINNIPWVGNAYNPESDKCELKTTYGSCTPPKGFLNTCEDCQRNITGGEANKLCTGLKIFISPSTKATPCEPSVRWQWNTYSGRCSNLTYGCLAQPETVGFDDESTCLETCEDIPLCGPASEQKPTTIAQ